MKGLFIDKNDVFEVKIYVAVASNTKIVVSNKKEDLKDFNEVREFKAVFRYPTYKDDVETIAHGMVDNQINMVNAQKYRLCSLIKSWDLPGPDGKILEPTSENINNLNPLIAGALTAGLVSFLDELSS